MCVAWPFGERDIGESLSEGYMTLMPFLIPSQNLLCLLRDVTVENAWPHSGHLICCLQSACIRLWRHRLENCV